MEFEGTHNVIGIRGIERNAADLVVKDGGLEEAVGLIPRDGSLIPYMPTENGASPRYPADTQQAAKQLLWARVHHTQNEDHTVYVYEDGYVVRKNDTYNTDVKPFEVADVKEIVFVGNRMDVHTSTGIEHWLWKNGEYKNVGDLEKNLYTRNEQTGATVFALPRAEFKVRRGIFDGSRIYEGVRFVRVIDDYTDADTKQEDKSEAIKEAYSSKYLTGDAMAVEDSVRALGGITGYILVAAAWRRKGSTPSNPQYIMASPVMLMGAPEIYMKDGKFTRDDSTYENPPAESYLIDMFDYGNEEVDWRIAGGQSFYAYMKNGELSTETDQEKMFDKLWEMPETDERDAEDLADGECVEVEKLETNDPCVIRTMNLEWGDDDPTHPDNNHSYKTDYTTSGSEAHGDKQVILRTNKYAIKNPALYQEKYAMYNHGNANGTDDNNAKHRCVTITHASGNILSIRISGEIEEKYKDEIDRLCVFVSPIINPYKGTGDASISMNSTYSGQPEKYTAFHVFNRVTSTGYKMHKACVAGSFLPDMKSPDEIRKAIQDLSGMYKIKEYQLSEVEGMSGWVDVPLNGKLESEKMVQKTDTMLKVTDMQPVNIVDGDIFGYNERLHIFGFQKSEVYRLPYSSMKYYKDGGQYSDEAGDAQDNWYTHGEKIIPARLTLQFYQYIITIVDKNDSTIVYTFKDKNPSLNPMVVHGDVEVQRIIVTKRYVVTSETPGVDPEYYAGTVECPVVEIAGLVGGYTTAYLVPLNIRCEQLMDDQEGRADEKYAALLPEEHVSVDGMSYGKNEIQVSNVGTTLFEASENYKVGHGKILGMARLAMSLSQDNYGKYPLVIFCTDGIYTMDVDTSGQTAYKIQSPLSREICSNVNGICEIDGAVVFPTEQGLFVVTQEGVKPVALSVRGAAKGYPEADATNAATTAFRGATDNGDLVELSAAFSAEDFLKYINDSKCHIRYVSQLSMIVCYRSDKAYTYIISVGDWSAWKLNVKILMDDMDYPKASFYVKKNPSHANEFKYVFNFEPATGEITNPDGVQCMMLTRPIKLDTTQEKAAYRVILRGVFNNPTTYQDEDPMNYHAGLYVFGSYGGDNWFILGGHEKKLNRFHDLGVETHRTSARFLRVLFVGTLGKDSHIDGLEITNEVRYNNKLK